MSMVLGLAFKFIKSFAFKTVRSVFGFYQGIFWAINGTYIQLWRSRFASNYSWSAHVQTVWFRHKLDLVLEPSSPTNFITTHYSFENPRYVLKKNVTLYYVTRTQAVFVETDPKIDAPHSDNGSFLRVAQFLNARRIITMPIATFHQLAESVGDAKGRLIFVSNPTRCGSTLLSQVFEETNRVLSFSEPDALNAIGLYEGRMPQKELDRLVVNSVRLLCKPVDRPIAAYILKTTAPTIDAVPMFIRLFPDSKQVFMYREGLKVAQSLFRSGKQMPLLELTFLVTPLSQTLTRKAVESMGLSPDMFKVKCIDGFVFSLYVWAVILDKYNQYLNEEMDIAAVRYEDLVKHPLQATQAVFKYCGLPVEWAHDGIRAMDKDAQRKSPLSMKNLRKHDVAGLTPQRKKQTDEICDQFNLPRIPEPCLLEGTITHVG